MGSVAASQHQYPWFDRSLDYGLYRFSHLLHMGMNVSYPGGTPAFYIVFSGQTLCDLDQDKVDTDDE